MAALRLSLLAGVCLLLTACPMGTAKLTIHNACSDLSIISIRFKGPTDVGDYRPNELDSDVPPGHSVQFGFEVPTRFGGLESDDWYVLCELSGHVACTYPRDASSTSLFRLIVGNAHASDKFDWYIDCSSGSCERVGSEYARAFRIDGPGYD